MDLKEGLRDKIQSSILIIFGAGDIVEPEDRDDLLELIMIDVNKAIAEVYADGYLDNPLNDTDEKKRSNLFRRLVIEKFKEDEKNKIKHD